MTPMKIPTRRRADEFTGALTVEAAAQWIGVTPTELRQRLGSGELPFVQVRNQIRIPRKALAAYREAMRAAKQATRPVGVATRPKR